MASPALIDGNAVAAKLRRDLVSGVAEFQAQRGVRPGLAVVLAGTDPASEVYVSRKVKQTREVGMASFEHRLPSDVSQAVLLRLVAQLNADPAVHGILVQLPLPRHIDAVKVLEAVAPTKDVDGFHPLNAGRLVTGTGGLKPCTALGCILLLRTVLEDFAGLRAVVVGRSNIVGKPVALLLLELGCTVTVAHSRTRALPAVVGEGDILVVAAGTPGLVRPEWIKAGAVVIDVGINRILREDGRTALVGDVASPEASAARAFTPVPGGVGPMTIACLLSNTLLAARALA